MITFKIGPMLRQYLTVIIADITFFQLGVHVAWLSPLLVQLKDGNHTIFAKTISDNQAAWLMSISSLVGISSFFYSGLMMDRFGRKFAIIFGCVPRLINCLMFLIATDVWMLMFGRAISGIADVFACSVTSSYASEIASKEMRGRLGTMAQIASALGSMVILSIGPFLDYMTLSITISCITVATFIPLLFLPESPYLLYAKGRVNESVAVLTLLRNGDAIEEELNEYSINISYNSSVSKFALLKDPVVIKTLAKSIFLAIASQMTGFNAVMFYLQSIFESTHTSLRPEISSVIIGCIQVLACFIAIAFTDRFGRKPLLTFSLIGLALGMLGLGAFFKLKNEHYEIVGFLNYLPLISIILVIGCFNAGIGATIWTLCAELFDGPSRAMGVSSAVVAATIFTFLTTRYFGDLTAALGPASTYWMFGGCCIIMCGFVIFFIPETKGKAFSEIQRNMGRENGAFEKTESIDLDFSKDNK